MSDEVFQKRASSDRSICVVCSRAQVLCSRAHVCVYERRNAADDAVVLPDHGQGPRACPFASALWPALGRTRVDRLYHDGGLAVCPTRGRVAHACMPVVYQSWCRKCLQQKQGRCPLVVTHVDVTRPGLSRKVANAPLASFLSFARSLYVCPGARSPNTHVRSRARACRTGRSLRASPSPTTSPRKLAAPSCARICVHVHACMFCVMWVHV